MYRRKTKVIIVMMIAVLLMIVGYAAFQTKLVISGTSNITGVWGIEITNIEGVVTGLAFDLVAPSYSGTQATIQTGLRKPGDKMNYSITVKNTGTIDAVIEDVSIKTEGSSVIVYYVDGLESGVRLGKGKTMDFTLSVQFDPNVTSIPSDNTKVIDIDIIAVQDEGQTLIPTVPNIDQTMLLSTKILNDNTAQADTDIDFTAISSDTNGKGLYYTSTNTEGNKITYYFRGDVTNNYVKFGKVTTETGCVYNGVNLNVYMTGITPTKEICSSYCLINASGTYYLYECGESNLNPGVEYVDGTKTWVDGSTSLYDIYWRIVRINEDGSIRLIYQGTNADATSSMTQIGTSVFNSSSSDNAYVGYMYGTVGSSTYEATHANTNDSKIKTVLDDWYEDNLKTNYSNYLEDAGFCNDRSVASLANTWNPNDTALGYGIKQTYYGAYSRLYTNKTPKFACPNADNDLFTTSASDKGNKALTNPIGLITADEVVYAGGVYSTTNSNYYLYTGSRYWTMSPYNTFAYGAVWNVGDDVLFALTSVEYGIRPVINLKGDVEVASGNGTSGSPYVIKTN